MAKLNCCLCLAILNEEREGRLLEGSPIALCDEHRCSAEESSRKPAEPEAAPSQYERACARAVLTGRASAVSLATIAPAFAMPASQAVN
jgi:hypothetical protein